MLYRGWEGGNVWRLYLIWELYCLVNDWLLCCFWEMLQCYNLSFLLLTEYCLVVDCCVYWFSLVGLSGEYVQDLLYFPLRSNIFIVRKIKRTYDEILQMKHNAVDLQIILYPDYFDLIFMLLAIKNICKTTKVDHFATSMKKSDCTTLGYCSSWEGEGGTQFGSRQKLFCFAIFAIIANI